MGFKGQSPLGPFPLPSCFVTNTSAILLLSKDIDTEDRQIEIQNVNEIYKHILASDARIVVCYGGRDSGKSYFVGGQYVPSLLCSDEYFRGVCVRKVFATHRDSCYQEVLDGLDVLHEQRAEREYNRLVKNIKQQVYRKAKKAKADGTAYDRDVEQQKAIDKIDVSDTYESIKEKQSPLEIDHTNGNKLLFKGLDKPKKLKSLKGINFVWVEEAEDLKREEFYEMLMLLRGGEKQQIVLTFNPVDEEHFANQMFVDCPADEVHETFANGDKKVWIKYLGVHFDGREHRIKTLCLRTTYEDNAYISIERKAAIEQLANTDPFLYDVYRLGKFGTRGGRILYNIEEVDFKAKGYVFTRFDNRGYVQDFGFNHANCILAVGEKDNCLYVFAELYGHEKDTAEWIAEADKQGLERRLLMVCDSAEPDRIKTWQRAGYRAVGVKKYPGSVMGQIDRLKRYEKIYINSDCKNTLREAREWKWKQKRGRFIDEPEDIADDAMAALRYSCDLFGDRQGAEMRTLGRR